MPERAGAAAVRDLVALVCYPLERPESEAYRRLSRECARQLAETGLLNLEGFLTPGGTARLVSEVEALMPLAHYAEREDNAYGSPAAEGMPADHPCRILHPTARWGIACHQMRGTVLEALYRWPPLREFVAAVTGHAKLYLHDDPSNALVLQIYKTGGRLAWHFDQALFSTILNLQESEAGGIFECAPNLRGPDSPCFDEVRRVLLGDSDRVQRHLARAGSFTIILGRYALHRVTTVRGPAPRISLILSYEDRPGVRMDVATRRKLFGPDAPGD